MCSHPSCRERSYRVITRTVIRSSHEGVRGHYTEQVPDHYECDGCSALFADPAKWSINRRDLARILVEFDTEHKPDWLK